MSYLAVATGHDPSWEADSSSPSQKHHRILRNPNVFLSWARLIQSTTPILYLKDQLERGPPVRQAFRNEHICLVF
jgi:hypothetical protein